MHDMTRTDSLYGRQLGEFILRDRLDAGGQGAVYFADQLGLHRRAAVKVLHQRDPQNEDAVRRFSREARLASRLDHPYAAHVYAHGVADDGLAWIAMELVRGVTLKDWLEEHGPMPLEMFVAFFENICKVVDAAHHRGIVHRDLKPANVMVISDAAQLLPKLLDFGLSRVLGEMAPPDPEVPRAIDESQRLTVRLSSQDSSRDSDPTGASMVLGTPPYLAPELWRGGKATPASDLYALGALAFQAVTGRAPFRGETVENISEQHLSARIPAVGGTLPVGLNPIFARALAKVPEDRYASATDLAAAFREVTDAQLAAQIRSASRVWHDRGYPAELLWRGSAAIELERWWRRASANLTPTEIAFVETSCCIGQREAEAEQRGRRRARRLGAGLAAALVVGIVGTVQWHAFYETELARQRATDAEHEARATAMTSEVEQGRAALLGGDTQGAVGHLGEAWRMGERSGSTAFMYARALQPFRAERAKLPAAHGRMWSASWSPDGRYIATTDDGGAQIWNGETYGPLATLPHGDIVYAAVWSGADRLVTACGDGAVRIWDVARGSLVRELRLNGRAPRWYAVAVHGSRIGAVDTKGAVAAAWDADTGMTLATAVLAGDGWPSMSFSADGRWLAVSGGGAAKIFDTTRWHISVLPEIRVHALTWDLHAPRLAVGTATGDLSICGPNGLPRYVRRSGGPIDAVAWSPTGTLAAALRDGTEIVLDAGGLVSVANHVHGRIAALRFSPDGLHLVAAASNGLIALSDAATGDAVNVFDASKNAARSVGFSPDGKRLTGATWDGAAWIWSTEAPYRRWFAPEQADSCGLVGGVEPDGRYLAVACVGHPTRVWDTARDMLLAELPALEDGEQVPYPVVSADGTLAAIARGKTAEVYGLPGGGLIRSIEHRAAVTAVVLDAGGTLVSGDAGGTVLVTRPGHAPLALTPGASDRIVALTTLQSGRIAAADTGGRVRVLDVTGGVIATFVIGVRARMLRPSTSGRRLLAVPSYAGAAATPVLLDLERSTLTRLAGPQVYSARWTEGGILTAHADGAARLWSSGGQLLRVFAGDRGFLADATLTPDGLVVGLGGDGALRFWDNSGRQVWKLATSRRYTGVSATPWGIVARSVGGEVSRWVLPKSNELVDAGKVLITLPFAGGIVVAPRGVGQR